MKGIHMKDQPLTDQDKHIIERLLQDDEDAWLNELVPLVEMLVKQHGWDGLLYKKGHEVGEVISVLYIQLREDDFKLLRNVKKSLVGTLYGLVNNAVKTVNDPKGRKGGGIEIEFPYPQMGNNNGESDDGTRQVKTIEEIAASTQGPGCSNVEPMQESDQTWRATIIRTAFTEFWRQKPRTAYALLFHRRLGMTYEQIGQLLGENGNTVQSWVYNARAWWSDVVTKINN